MGAEKYGREFVPAKNGVGVVEVNADGMIGIFMDTYDWEFVIDCLRFRARNGSGADTIERATFTADSILDVLSSPS